MDTNLLEISEFSGIGYKPLIDYSTWRVAMLRFIDELIPDRVERVERHRETDEVFVLLAGQAILFIAEGDWELTALKSLVMEPGKLYNVKRNAWHAVILSQDASILLVENRDTGTANTDYTALSAPFRQSIIDICNQEKLDCWQ